MFQLFRAGLSKAMYTSAAASGNLLSSTTNTTTTLLRRSIFLLTEFNAVDNSELGQTQKRYRKPYLIGFYRKRRTADVGDVIRVAVKGRPCKAVVVNTRKRKLDMEPRYDNNNIVLVDDNLAPLGGKINGPMPTKLRRHKDKYPKLLSQIKTYV